MWFHKSNYPSRKNSKGNLTHSTLTLGDVKTPRRLPPGAASPRGRPPLHPQPPGLQAAVQAPRLPLRGTLVVGCGGPVAPAAGMLVPAPLAEAAAALEEELTDGHGGHPHLPAAATGRRPDVRRRRRAARHGTARKRRSQGASPSPSNRRRRARPTAAALPTAGVERGRLRAGAVRRWALSPRVAIHGTAWGRGASPSVEMAR